MCKTLFVGCCLLLAVVSFCQEESAPANVKDPGVSAPSLLRKVEPEYSDEARRKNISGNILLSIIVGKDGVPRNIKVISPLGFGLDEKAIQAVSNWRFKPGTKNGFPVDVLAQVEVSFRRCTNGCENPQLSHDEQARTLVNTAIHQMRGDLGEKANPRAAFENMQKAAAMDFGPAETRLGEFYLAGVGTAVDNAKAAELFDRAAFHGDPEGEFALGTVYRDGLGVSRDQAMALKLFMRAAEKDNRDAEYALGLANEKGEGIEQDLPQAAKWYRKSAEQGHPDAALHLAQLYWAGSVGKPDQVAALEWVILAEKTGSKAAPSLLQQYRAAMPPDRIAEAEKHAERFKPRAPKPKP